MRPDASSSIEEITTLADPAARNRAITRLYVRLSRRVATAAGTQDANWLTFGAWASASAGRFIRGEGLTGDWGAEAVSAGNTAIIMDIAPRFTTFLDLYERHPVSGKLDEIADVVSGTPGLNDTPELRDAFECYARAIACSADPEQDEDHAQLMLRANVGIAHHEQDFADSFVDAAIPGRGLVGQAASAFVTVAIPDGSLMVTRDIPSPRYLDGAQWPAALAHLRDPALLEMAHRYGQDPESDRYANATSWESFEERMGFIFCFFRAYQRDPSMHRDPLT